MQDKYPAVFGEFVWTGFDYLGEPTPYGGDLTGLRPGTRRYEQAKALLDKQNVTEVPSRSSYFGIIDIAGFKKDRFYLYQSKWRPDLAMAHILPHWNWPERTGKVTPVHLFTSGDEAELFINGRSQGRKKKEPGTCRLRWDEVRYERGELRAVVWKNEKRWAVDRISTAGQPERLTAKADRSHLNAGGEDLSFVTVTIADNRGNLVPRSNNLVKFSIEGPADIVATDNGDPTDMTSFPSLSRRAFNGMALAIIRTRAGETGRINLRITSPGLKDKRIMLKSR